MSDNGNSTWILKVELVDKQIKVTFNKDVPNTLLYDRAIRMLNLHLDNMLIASQQEEKKVIPVPPSLINKIRGNHGR